MFSRSEDRDVTRGRRVVSEDALDPHPYPILLAEEINYMFTKTKHSYFVADIFFGAKTTLLVSAGFFFHQCAMDLTRSLDKNKTESKLTNIQARCCY